MSPLLLAALAGCGQGCPQEVATGRYCAVAPEDWDGSSPLDAVMMLHGYGGSPDQYTGKDSVVEAFSGLGVLLIAPEGLDSSWVSLGSPEEPEAARDDVAFLSDVWADVGERWPLARRFGMGFSLGSSMALSMAVQQPELYAAHAVMSGGFWEPLPDSCPAALAPVSYTNGTADGTWPVEGRTLGIGDASYTQAPLEDNLAYWRACMGCSEASEIVTDGPLTCEVWADCDAGLSLRSCLHDEGHERLDGWEERQVSWLLESAR